MSIEAINWALNHAPIPSSPTASKAACAAVLVGLANHAGPDGRHAFPSIERLVTYTCLSRRGVQNALRCLLAAGVVIEGDNAVAMAHIKNAGTLPTTYHLNMGLVDDQRGANLAPHRNQRGASPAPQGVQDLHERGANLAPKPSINHPTKPSTVAPAASQPDAPAESGTLPGMEEAAAEPLPAQVAQAIASEWWERFTPRPATPYVGQRKIIQRLLVQGWPAAQVRAAVGRSQPPLVLARLEQDLRAMGTGGDNRNVDRYWEQGGTWEGTE